MAITRTIAAIRSWPAGANTSTVQVLVDIVDDVEGTSVTVDLPLTILNGDLLDKVRQGWEDAILSGLNLQYPTKAISRSPVPKPNTK